MVVCIFHIPISLNPTKTYFNDFELLLNGFNRSEGVKYLEYAAKKDNPTAVYIILLFTDYKTNYYYKKLISLAKKNDQAKQYLWLYENPE